MWYMNLWLNCAYAFHMQLASDPSLSAHYVRHCYDGEAIKSDRCLAYFMLHTVAVEVWQMIMINNYSLSFSFSCHMRRIWYTCYYVYANYEFYGNNVYHSVSRILFFPEMRLGERITNGLNRSELLLKTYCDEQAILTYTLRSTGGMHQLFWTDFLFSLLNHFSVKCTQMGAKQNAITVNVHERKSIG